MGRGFVAEILPSTRKGVPPVPAAGKTPLAENATLGMDYPRSILLLQCHHNFLKGENGRVRGCTFTIGDSSSPMAARCVMVRKSLPSTPSLTPNFRPKFP